MDDNRKPTQGEDNGMRHNQEEEHDVKHIQGNDNDANPNQEVDYERGEEEKTWMIIYRKPTQGENNGMRHNQEEEHDVKHIQGNDNDANPNQGVDYERGEDEEDMDDETTPSLAEDGNDHVTTMKPLATLQKHEVREKADLAYHQSPCVIVQVVGKAHNLYCLHCASGVLARSYRACDLEPFTSGYCIPVNDWENDPRISLREAAQNQAPWNAFTGNKCNCRQGGCESERCHCKKIGIKCSSHCHRGENCKNKQYDGKNQPMTTTATRGCQCQTRCQSKKNCPCKSTY